MQSSYLLNEFNTWHGHVDMYICVHVGSSFESLQSLCGVDVKVLLVVHHRSCTVWCIGTYTSTGSGQCTLDLLV